MSDAPTPQTNDAFDQMERMNTLALDLAGPGSPEEGYLETVARYENARHSLQETMSEQEPTPDTEDTSSES